MSERTLSSMIEDLCDTALTWYDELEKTRASAQAINNLRNYVRNVMMHQWALGGDAYTGTQSPGYSHADDCQKCRLTELINQVTASAPVKCPAPVGTRIFVHDRNNPSKGWLCVMGEDGTYTPLDYIECARRTRSTGRG